MNCLGLSNRRDFASAPRRPALCSLNLCTACCCYPLLGSWKSRVHAAAAVRCTIPLCQIQGRGKKIFFPNSRSANVLSSLAQHAKGGTMLILTIISLRQRLKGLRTLNISRNRPGWLRRNAWPLPAVLSSSIMACQNLLHYVLQMRSSPPVGQSPQLPIYACMDTVHS